MKLGSASLAGPRGADLQHAYPAPLSLNTGEKQMRHYRFYPNMAAAAAFLVALGCDTISEPAPTTARVSLAAGSGPSSSATGRADFVVVPPSGTNPGFAEQYSFGAVRHPNGEFDGQFETKFDFFGQEFSLHGEVLCFTIVGTDRARLGGRVTRSDTPGAPVGQELIWTVVDNGEGANAPDDQAMRMLNGNAAAWCAAGSPFAVFTSDRANIQVHP
jgi:hypothetical protein